MTELSLDSAADHARQEYVTFYLSGQLFGLPILEVHDVFLPVGLTKVPLSAPEIAGILNLRGRIVTAINVSRSLAIQVANPEQKNMAIGIEHRAEMYGLIVDGVGEVVAIEPSEIEPNPSNLDSRLSGYSSGVYRLNDRLLVILDIRKLLDKSSDSIAA